MVMMSLPHARGGVSEKRLDFPLHGLSSPRPWGCFLHFFLLLSVIRVFPTPVGVFPMFERDFVFERRLPHARGGVSTIECASA